MGGELAYLTFGATLCVLLALLGVFAYRRGHERRAEAPKYRMLEDDDDR